MKGFYLPLKKIYIIVTKFYNTLIMGRAEQKICGPGRIGPVELTFLVQTKHFAPSPTTPSVNHTFFKLIIIILIFF